MLDSIKTNYSSAYSEIQNIINNTGAVIGENAQSAIKSLSDMATAIESVNKAQANATNISSNTDASGINTDYIDTSTDATTDIENKISGDTKGKLEQDATQASEQKKIQDAINAENSRIQAEQEAKAKWQAEAKNNANLKTKAQNVLSKAKKGTGKKKKDGYSNHSTLWQHIYNVTKYHRMTTESDQYNLAKALGVNVSGENLNNTDKQNILAKMKAIGYKKGTKSVPNNGSFWTHNDEIIIRKSDGAMLTRLSKGSSVIPENLSQNLFKWGAIDPVSLNSALSSASGISNIPTTKDVTTNVTNHYDSLLTVNGNVDKDALPKLEEILKQSYQYTTKQMSREARKLGF